MRRQHRTWRRESSCVRGAHLRSALKKRGPPSPCRRSSAGAAGALPPSRATTAWRLPSRRTSCEAARRVRCRACLVNPLGASDDVRLWVSSRGHRKGELVFVVCVCVCSPTSDMAKAVCVEMRGSPPLAPPLCVCGEIYLTLPYLCAILTRTPLPPLPRRQGPSSRKSGTDAHIQCRQALAAPTRRRAAQRARPRIALSPTSSSRPCLPRVSSSSSSTNASR